MAKTDKKSGLFTPLISVFDSRSNEMSRRVHMHDTLQLLAGISGTLEISIDSKKINLRVGDVIIIKNRVPHSTRAILPFTTTIAISLSPALAIPALSCELTDDLADVLTDSQERYVYMRREDAATAEAFSIITKMSDEATKKEGNYTLFIEGYTKILLGTLQRNQKLCAVSCNTESIKRIYPVFEYAESNYSQDISLEEISSKLGMSREYFCRCFKKATGLPFIDYLNTIRVKRAEYMLMTAKKSISEISDEIGFSSVSYFTRVFKNITNSTPSYYKNIEYLA